MGLGMDLFGVIRESSESPEKSSQKRLKRAPLGSPEKGLGGALIWVLKGGLEGPLFLSPGVLGGPGIPYF